MKCQMLTDMDFSLSAIFSSLLFSTIGFYVFRWGRKNNDFKIIFIGIALMAFSYFTTGPWADWGVGFILCGLAYFLK